ncbi:hypothetical protein MKX03_017740 [Papaver bracteatum]|nr:hypothetical protein MKX03_017740 [Papaver bracteatum]
MNREPANRSMGFCAIYKEAFKLTALNKKIFSQITLTILLPLAFFYLSDIQISNFILTKAYPENKTSRWIAYGITQSIYLILLLIFTPWSTSSVVYTIACFYTSRDITYKKVTGVLGKLWGRLMVTFLWCFFTVAIYSFVALCLWWSRIFDEEGRIRPLAFIICLSIPVLAVLIFFIVVCSIATVVTVLEKDYGGRAFAKSMVVLINGKIMVSCAVFGLLETALTGIIFMFCYLVVYGNKMSLVGKVFVGIGCHLLLAVWIHFLLVVQTVVYFVCKSHHNEDVSTVGTHLEISVIHLGREIKDVQLERVPAV